MTREKILVTGGSSMIGKKLIPILELHNYIVDVPTKEKMNCLSFENVRDYFLNSKPDYCIHLAGKNGNIAYNAKAPADIYMQTAYMALNVLSVSSTFCQKIVSVLPSCAYSAFDELGEPRSMLFEQDFEKGLPHASVEMHGMAKRILFNYSRQLHKQFQTNCVCCVLNNCFGDGAPYDQPDRLKVADSMIERFVKAKYEKFPEVVLWGDGSPRRELLYNGDAALGIFFVFQNYNDPTEVINVGNGEDIPILDLALTIRDLVGYEGEILWDKDRPNGQMKKLFAPYKIQELGWTPQTNLVDGLKETISWYERKAGYVK